MIRKPVVAGSFYPASPSGLEEMVAGMVDDSASREEVVGLICPHAGYIYSGPVAGAAISRIKFIDTFIIMGPNHTGLGKPFSIMTSGTWETPLGNVEIDSDLAEKLLGNSSYLEADTEAHLREHSIEVQLPFLQHFKKDVKIVPIVLSHASSSVYKEIGLEIAEVLGELGRDAVILASSDMTHYEPAEQAKRKDNSAIEAILRLDEDELLERIAEQNITMCGYAPVVALISAAKVLGAHRAELVRYQTSGEASGDYSSVVGYAGLIIPRQAMSPLVRLAHEAIDAYVKEGRIMQAPATLTPEMQEEAGVFVSLHKGGELRGCIGTFEPSRRNVAEEIIMNGISAAMRDPRFEPVREDELKDLDISVDVLTEPEPIESKEQLNPKKYGAIVQRGARRGLLLPDLEGVDTAEQQIDICRLKADIMPDEKVRLYRFEVKRYH
ncbi:MAG: AmmeMemoRadiSam system protein B [Dehalococcoidia bacterium]|nr:MAG: AmmeMemoRadiSam system protein B [Dehalococcoidia bacterium]